MKSEKNGRFFIKPIIIIGAPRSGTSLLQKLIREHSSFVSLAKESDIIWNRYCHPRFRNWESDECSGELVDELMIKNIRQEFAAYVLPAHVWQKLDQRFKIMRYQRYPFLSFFLRHSYKLFALTRQLIPSQKGTLRLVEKSVNNSFRINLINKVFPDAKYIYIQRDGRATINSLINGWREPNRFFSYQLPIELTIPNYPYDKWNFALPPGWQNYINKPLEEVVAFQWVSIHNAILKELAKPTYQNRVLTIKLEGLSSNSRKCLQQISDFIEVPWSNYFEQLVNNLPVVNSLHTTNPSNKWRLENKEMVKRIEPFILETMNKLGYDMD